MLARVPIVIGTEVNIYEHKRRAHALAERVLMAGTDRLVVSAESVRDFYVTQVHADRAKIDVIYNAVDFTQAQPTTSRAEMRKALGVPPEARVAGIIARLTEQKGHRYLFEALAAQPSLADVHLLVVGGGELREALVRDAEQKGLSTRVHFLGPRRDLGNLLAAVDLFVMASLWEGLPLSMVLAMGAGLPIVATRVAGIPEVVADGRTGLLVAPRDSNALGSARARLLGDADLRRRMGDEARASVLPRFGVDRYVESVASLYDRLLAQESA
jgi:glycosyltransferase involved in cell wall biosynthesis